MQKLKRGFAVFGLLAAGYVCGSFGLLNPNGVWAQPDGISENAAERVKAAYETVNTAMLGLEQERRYVPAVKGVNSFAVLAGGVDAVQDLETGRGVDPETFAALYAGRVADHISPNISRDAEGRITYKKKVVRMYPVARLKELFDRREKIATGEE